MAHIDDIKLYTKTCVYKSPAIKASFVRLKENEEYLDTSNYNSSLYYIIEGNGTLNQVEYNTGDVLCINSFANISAKENTIMYNVEDSPLMDYYNVKMHTRDDYYTIKYTHDEIMQAIESIHETNPNRLGVIFGTEESNTISNTLWCLMTKTLPNSIQPPHRHNSVAIDYCVNGEGYTLLSQQCEENGELIDPVKINWKAGMVFVTPPGWWHSHHNTGDTPAYIFPVQDASLHMHLDTLDIQFV